MAPIRRYLRITRYSVLEVRIYLDRPSDTAWLLSTRGGDSDAVLPRIIRAVRPKVLPKLREENENARRKSGAKGKKKKGIKDVASSHDFSVSIFLKETSTRHSLLTKHKRFTAPSASRLRSTSNQLTGWLNTGDDTNPIDLDAVVREESPSSEVGKGDGALYEIPRVGSAKKQRTGVGRVEREGGRDEDEALFVGSSDEETFFQTQRDVQSQRERRRRRGRGQIEGEQEDEEAGEDGLDDDEDDKKKLGLQTTYDGFSIYGRILCLIVSRKGGGGGGGGGGGRPDESRAAATAAGVDDLPVLGGSQMMEQWVSTQAAQENGLADDDEG